MATIAAKELFLIVVAVTTWGPGNVIRLWLLLLDEGVGGDGIFVKMSVF